MPEKDDLPPHVSRETPRANWGAIGVVVAVLMGLLSLLSPEVRSFMGLGDRNMSPEWTASSAQLSDLSGVWSSGALAFTLPKDPPPNWTVPSDLAGGRPVFSKFMAKGEIGVREGLDGPFSALVGEKWFQVGSTVHIITELGDGLEELLCTRKGNQLVCTCKCPDKTLSRQITWTRISP